jgi:predicted transcriptional regulator
MPKKITATEGKRFTVLHEECKFGFLKGCKFLLNINIDSYDYHKTMNGCYSTLFKIIQKMGRRIINSIAAMPVANSANLKEESNVKYVGICRKKRIVF